MSERDALRESFEDEFDDVEYPITNPMELTPHLSKGPATKFEGEDVSLSAMELMTKVQPHVDDAPNEGFPYDDLDSMLEDLFYCLEEEGIVGDDE